MLIGILQCGHLPDEIQAVHGDYDTAYARLLGGRGYAFATYPVVDMVFPESPLAADGWLISGSRFGAYDAAPFIPPLEEFIRAVRDSGRPLIGICFGHQIIAQALGGRVEKFAGGWGAGPQKYRIGADTLDLIAWHQDQVVEPPKGARHLGSSDFCEHAVLAYGDTILTMQPHPEFDPAMTAILIEARRGVVPADRLAEAEAGLSRPLDIPAAADMIAAVLEGRP